MEGREASWGGDCKGHCGDSEVGVESLSFTVWIGKVDSSGINTI